MKPKFNKDGTLVAKQRGVIYKYMLEAFDNYEPEYEPENITDEQEWVSKKSYFSKDEVSVCVNNGLCQLFDTIAEHIYGKVITCIGIEEVLPELKAYKSEQMWGFYWSDPEDIAFRHNALKKIVKQLKTKE